MKHYCSFSEAIREGAKLRPQTFRAYVRDGGTCAMGAGLEAILERPLTIEECLSKEGLRDIARATEFWDRFAYLRTETITPCGCAEPAGFDDFNHNDDTSLRIDNLIVHLNNVHRWTREAIADWLESEEEKLGFVTVVEEEKSEPVAALLARGK